MAVSSPDVRVAVADHVIRKHNRAHTRERGAAVLLIVGRNRPPPCVLVCEHAVGTGYPPFTLETQRPIQVAVHKNPGRASNAAASTV